MKTKGERNKKFFDAVEIINGVQNGSKEKKEEPGKTLKEEKKEEGGREWQEHFYNRFTKKY